MLYNESVIEMLKRYISFDLKDIVFHEIESNGLSFIQIRDRILMRYTILEENIPESVYITSVKTGVLDANNVVVAVCLSDEVIQMYAVSKNILSGNKLQNKAFNLIEKCLID